MRVALRKEKLSKGRQSLYLDIYNPKGKGRQKRLGMFLEPATSISNREKNKETMRLAKIVRNK
jgi:hypothetical protein